MLTNTRMLPIAAGLSVGMTCSFAPGEGSERPDGSVTIGTEANLPFFDTGDTTDNFDDTVVVRNAEQQGVNTCPWPNAGNPSPDVYYMFTPTVDVTLTITLCGSSFDTQLYVLDESLTQLYCDEDGCDLLPEPPGGTWRSTLRSVALRGGEVYFLCVDGYAGSAEGGFGAYEILVEADDLPCLADLTNDRTINVDDLLILFNSWGACAECPADLDGSGSIDVGDLLILFGAWGDCPGAL